MTSLSSADRMTLNAAMELLASGKEEGWLEAAQVVTDFGRTLPMSTPYVEMPATTSRNNTSFSGFVAGIGDMLVRDNKSQQIEGGTIGGNMERIGNYKIAHNNQNGLIRFFHYRQGLQWQLNETIPQNDFVIYYSEEGTAHTVARLLWEDLFCFNLTTLLLLIKTYVDIFRRRWNLRSWRLYRENKIVFMHCLGVRIIHSTHIHLTPGQFVPGV